MKDLLVKSAFQVGNFVMIVRGHYRPIELYSRSAFYKQLLKK